MTNLGWLFILAALPILRAFAGPFKWALAYAWILGGIAAFYPGWHEGFGANGTLALLLAQDASSFLTLLLAFTLYISVAPHSLKLRRVYIRGLGGLALAAAGWSCFHGEFMNSRLLCIFIVLALGVESKWTFLGSLSAIALLHAPSGGLVLLGQLVGRTHPKKYLGINLFLAVVIGIIAMLLFGLDGKFLLREQFLMQAWHLHFDGHWQAWLGRGPGTWSLWSLVKQSQQVLYTGSAMIADHVHNDWAEAFFELGPVGFGLFAWAAADLFWKTKSRRARSDLAGLAAAMLVQWPMHFAPIVFLSWVFAKDAYEASER